MARKIGGLKQLGVKTPLPKSPGEAGLERVANPHQDTAYVARFTCPEFTCLCPVTGQPDFAHLVIDYAPRGWLAGPITRTLAGARTRPARRNTLALLA